MSNVVTDLSGGISQGWDVGVGFHNTFTITCTSSAVAFPITTYTFTLKIFRWGSSSALITLTQGSGLTNGGASGVLTVVLTAAQSAQLTDGEYFWSLTAVHPDTFTYRWLKGNVNALTQELDGDTASSLSLSLSLSGSDIDLAITLAGAAAEWGDIGGTLSDQTDLVAALALKANLASPALTGNPTAPTQSPSDNSTKIATTAYVDAAVAAAGGITGLTTDRIPYATSATSLGSSTIAFAASSASGLRPSTRMQSWVGVNSGTTPVEFYNHGKLAATSDPARLAMPKGFVAINWSLNMVNNWQWDEADQRAEPFDTDLPMVGIELGGEGTLDHWTKPGDIPATAFHEITRFGGSVDGLSGVNPYGGTVPFNQFKSCIYAQYRANTTPDAATEHPWWGGSNNTLNGVLNPLLWLRSEEVKGSGYNVNELANFEMNGGVTAYPTVNFTKSNGSFETKTAITTNNVMGRIGSNVWDGSAYQNTAAIEFVSRGTISSGNAGQGIRFQTSSSNTAGLSSKMEVSHDHINWGTVPLRYLYGSITTIPDYSAIFTSPATTTSTLGNISQVSTSTGGMNIVGFSTTSTASTAIAMVVSGVLGATAPTAPAIILSGRKHNGTTGYADLASTEIILQLRNNSTAVVELLGSGNIGFGVTGPTAKVQIRSTANNAVALLVEDDGGNDILSVGESGGARVVGFFGVTPAIRQVVATGSTTDQVITGLQNLGLFSQT